MSPLMQKLSQIPITRCKPITKSEFDFYDNYFLANLDDVFKLDKSTRNCILKEIESCNDEYVGIWLRKSSHYFYRILASNCQSSRTPCLRYSIICDWMDMLRAKQNNGNQDKFERVS